MIVIAQSLYMCRNLLHYIATAVFTAPVLMIASHCTIAVHVHEVALLATGIKFDLYQLKL